MKLGYIKLYRQLCENPMWQSEEFTRGQAWVDMLLLASHADTFVRIRGVRVDLKPGELAVSEKEFASRWKWSRGKVRRFLSELESKTVQQIVQQKNNVTTVVSICNWSRYQANGTADGTPNGTTDGHQTVQQTDTYKNVKNVENVEEEHTARAGLSQLVNDVIAAINATKVGAKLGVMAFPPIEKTLSDMIADGVAGTDIRGMLQWYRENHTKPYVPGFKYPAGFGEWYDSIIAARRRIEQEAQGKTGLAIGQIYQGNDDEPLPF